MNMLFTILQSINTIIFLVISGFHFYWAFGGKFGVNAVIPEIKGKAAFKPPILATIFVAFAMLIERGYRGLLWEAPRAKY